MRGPNEGGKNLYYIEYAFQKVGINVGRSPGFMTSAVQELYTWIWHASLQDDLRSQWAEGAASVTQWAVGGPGRKQEDVQGKWMGSCDRAAGSVWKGAIRCVTWSTGIMKKKAESKLSQGSQITLVLTLKEEIVYQKEEE